MAEPLSVADAKLHLRVDGEDEDALITGIIAAAVDHVERATGLVLSQRPVSEPVAGFGARLNTWPITSIDSITYTDGVGASQTLDVGAWSTNLLSRPVRLSPISSGWPALGAGDAPVTVNMTAGYEDGKVPAGIVAALKLIVGHLYRNREGATVGVVATELPMGVESLLMPHRMWFV